jgi:hypothetical protein
VAGAGAANGGQANAYARNGGHATAITTVPGSTATAVAIGSTAVASATETAPNTGTISTSCTGGSGNFAVAYTSATGAQVCAS